MENLQSILNTASAFAALVAAVLWFWSTRVNVKFGTASATGWQDGGLIDFDGNDQLATLRLANQWNMRASFAAGVAAILQAAALYIK